MVPFFSSNNFFQKLNKTLKFVRQQKTLQNSRTKTPAEGGGLDAGAHESPHKIDLESKFRGEGE